jgi:hypothetical protein
MLGTDGSAERVPVRVEVLVTNADADVDILLVPVREDETLLLDVPETDELRVTVLVLLVVVERVPEVVAVKLPD